VFADGKSIQVTNTPSIESQGQFSPDGRWVAYTSDESRRNEIWIQSLPAAGGKWQISATGGTQPRWSRDGKELFFVSEDGRLIAIAVKAGSTLEFGPPQPLFQLPFPNVSAGFAYAAAGDGKRFLIKTRGGEKHRPIIVITNWLAVAKR
jgi:dipeptidyl aminopeptidase/acylaminoacyl peptidase